MREYSEIASRLNGVRWAWKRTAMLSGLAAVILEAVGIFVVAILIDYLYEPLPAARVGLAVLALVAVFILLARHVITPLMRAIPDTQVALYVEEHCPKFEGALLSAAEFGRATDLPSEQAAIIDAVLEQAALRARQIDLKQVLDLRRLRKYGIVALCLLGAFVVSGILFPDTFGHRAGRILKPWAKTHEDRQRMHRIAIMKQPIGFQLSTGDARLLRGTPFGLEAVLSRASDRPVNLHFRPLSGEEDESEWRKLPMENSDVLNGFQLTLPDINENVEWYVSTGKYRSSSHTVTVYDPLQVEGVEVVTTFPKYLELEPVTENTPSGDVAAPLESSITVRVLTNARLKQGRLVWEDGTTQPLARDPERPTTAYASFKITKDTTYGFAIEDVDEQEVESPGLAYVKALTDRPPGIEILYPKIDVSIHPLGEVTFEARAVDDFGVAGVDMVYTRGAEEDSNEIRIPLSLAELAPAADEEEEGDIIPGTKQATLRLAFEEITPKVVPGDFFSYYLECRDRKGQKAITDMFFMAITNFEVWATWKPELAEHGHEITKITLGPFLAAAWHLHQQKDVLAEGKFKEQCAQLAESMTNPETGGLYSFVDMALVPQDKLVHAKRAVSYIEQGHKVLEKADTSTCLKKWRVAMAELTLLGLGDTSTVMAGAEGNGGAMEEEERKLGQIAFMEEARLEGEGFESTMKLVKPEYQRKLLEAEEAEKLKKEVEKQEEQQRKLTEEAKELQAKLDPKNPEMQPKPMPVHQKKALEQQVDKLAQKQKQQAQAAREASEEMKKHDAAQDPKLKRAAEKLDQAAREMQKAAAELSKKEMPKAVATMQRAQKELADARKQLQGVHQEKLERALNLAETHTEKLLEEQRQVRQATEKTAKTQAGKPDKKMDATQERDMKKLAHEQARLRKQFNEVEKHVEKLRDWSGETNKRETAEHVEKAERTLRRSQVKQKMTNALVELAKKQAARAATQQKKAENSLEKTLAEIRKANDSLAADRESELKRAKREAERIEKALKKLDPNLKAKGEAKPGEKDPNKQDGDKKTAGKQDPTKTDGDKKTAGKQDPTKTDGDKKTAGKQDPTKTDGDKKTAGKQDPTKTDGDKKTAGKQDPNNKGDDKSDAGEKHAQADDAKSRTGESLSTKQRKALVQNLKFDVKRLAKHLDRREFAEKKDRDFLKQRTEDLGRLGMNLQQNENERQKILDVVARVRDRLEKEIQSTLQAKKLFSAQREECPPRYRAMVNKYYEALSKGKK